jgi:hypothetical protein
MKGGLYHRLAARRMGLDYIEVGLVGQGIGVVLLGVMIMDNRPGLQLPANLLIALGSAVLVAGCGAYAAYHGRSRWWGLLGLLSLGGIVAVMCLANPHLRTGRRGFAVIFAEPYRKDVWRMDVRVLVDSSLAGSRLEPIMLQLPRGANIASAVKTLAPVLAPLRREPADLKYLINGQPAKPTDEMTEGDELMIAPRDAAATSPDQISTTPS